MINDLKVIQSTMEASWEIYSIELFNLYFIYFNFHALFLLCADN